MCVLYRIYIHTHIPFIHSLLSVTLRLTQNSLKTIGKYVYIVPQGSLVISYKTSVNGLYGVMMLQWSERFSQFYQLKYSVLTFNKYGIDDK